MTLARHPLSWMDSAPAGGILHGNPSAKTSKGDGLSPLAPHPEPTRAMKYYYTDAQNKPAGPVELEQLKQLQEKGTITPQSYVIPEGGTQWTSYAFLLSSLAQASSVAATTTAPAAPSQPAPAPAVQTPAAPATADKPPAEPAAQAPAPADSASSKPPQEPKSAPTPEPKPETKPAPKPEAKPEPQPAVKSEARPESPKPATAGTAPKSQPAAAATQAPAPKAPEQTPAPAKPEPSAKADQPAATPAPKPEPVPAPASAPAAAAPTPKPAEKAPAGPTPAKASEPKPAPAKAAGPASPQPTAETASPDPVELISSQLARYIDLILQTARSTLSEQLLRTILEIFKRGGYALVLVGAVLGFVQSIVTGIRIGSFQGFVSSFGAGLVATVAIAVLQYVAFRFFTANDTLVKNNPSRIGSAAFLDCLALVLLVGAFTALVGGLFACIAAVSVVPIIPGLIGAALLLFGAGVTLHPALCNIEFQEASAGEEAIGVASFFGKASLVIQPVLFGALALGGTFTICAGFFSRSTADSVAAALRDIPAAGLLAGAGGSAFLVLACLVPAIYYLGFLVLYLHLDLIRAVLGLPRQLRELRR